MSRGCSLFSSSSDEYRTSCYRSSFMPDIPEGTRAC